MEKTAVPTRGSIVLELDGGMEMRFSGRLFANGEREALAARLYAADAGGHVYSLKNGTRSSAYRVQLYGDACVINDGHTGLTVDLEMLMLAIRELSGLDAQINRTELDLIRDTLRSASC